MAEAYFQIRNSGKIDVKDINTERERFAPRGTFPYSATCTIYEISKTGKTKEFRKFNIGFVNSQVARSQAALQSAIFYGK